MFNLDVITNKNNRNDGKILPYRMSIIGPSGSGKTKHYLIKFKNKITTTLLTRFICMPKIYLYK